MATNNDDLLPVIGDFLEMGHVENIVAMFKQDVALYGLTGELLRDERFMVRLGVAVLFEELAMLRPEEIPLAIPSLLPLLNDPTPYIRGEACNLLGIIATDQARLHLAGMQNDPDPQVREIVRDNLGCELSPDLLATSF
ncbi:MAG: HEAT repeat domain-containing protein [Proteobacteria bacterium]|nr:HEAT repeat domain-containing protein [Pseudomonadota bacterium]MBU1716589.1 HEAT repeat domain-containing protein [Pseudomonadota bacterium]